MQNHKTEQQLNEFVETMERKVMPRAMCALALFAVLAALYACNQAYGAHVTIAAALALIPVLLAVGGFVVARNRKEKPDNT
jgi:hypothetical protein